MDITDICFEHIKTVNDVQYHRIVRSNNDEDG